jgi:hypothetical protein
MLNEKIGWRGTGFSCFRIRTNGGLLWLLLPSMSFQKRKHILVPLAAERLFTSQAGIISMVLQCELQVQEAKDWSSFSRSFSLNVRPAKYFCVTRLASGYVTSRKVRDDEYAESCTNKSSVWEYFENLKLFTRYTCLVQKRGKNVI